MEMNDILLKEAGVMSRPFSEEYLCDIESKEEQKRVLSALSPMAEMAQHVFPLDHYKSKVLRTLRDTVYRLRKEGCLSDESKRVNKEVLFSAEELLIIMLEKRMANKRIRKQRVLLFHLPQGELQDLMCVHPKEFNNAVEECITKQERAILLQQESSRQALAGSGKLSATLGAGTKDHRADSLDSVSDSDSTNSIMESEASYHVATTPARAEEIITDTITSLGIPIGETEALLIKALSLKVEGRR